MPVFGSSPRAWGTPSAATARTTEDRFIPTGVGNTFAAMDDAEFDAVHPHGRGEHIPILAINAGRYGSSPRAWGTLHAPRCERTLCRFIPTGVGNTQPKSTKPRKAAVHPHGRGEHLPLQSWHHLHAGSSPRAWGTPSTVDSGIPSLRFIPTGVGNTGSKSQLIASWPVHPHGRGEHV